MQTIETTLGLLQVPGIAPLDAIERMADGRYEHSVLAAAERVLGKDDVVIDAGGGVGFAAHRLARLASEVWSVEADPVLWEALRANLAELPNAHALHGVLALAGMLGPGGGWGRFWRSGDYRGSSAIPEEGFEGLRVPVVNLLDLMAQTHATALVLDVEGLEVDLLAEPEVLVGLRALVVEWHPTVEDADEREVAERAIADAGFVPVWRATEQPVVAYSRRS